MVDVDGGSQLEQPPHEIALTIPAKAEYVALTRLAISGLKAHHELDDDAVADLKLAVTEACSDIIQHLDAVSESLGDSAAGPQIRVEYALYSDRWTVSVRDEAGGFRYEPKLGDTFSDSGLGITIIQALVDELDLVPRPGGMMFRLTKHLG